MEKRNSLADLVGMPSQFRAGLPGTLQERILLGDTPLAQTVPAPFTRAPTPAPIVRGILADCTDANGFLDKSALARERAKLQKEIAPKIAEHDRAQAMLKTLERFLEILKSYNLGQHDRPLSMLHLRSKLRPEYFFDLEKTAKPPPIERFKQAHWFDFRRLPTSRADEMIKFGEELLNAGIVRLPFDVCVFVFPYVCPDGAKVTSACLLRQSGDKVIAEAVIHMEATGKPLGMYGPDKPPNEPIFYALAVLSSRSIVQRKRSVASEAEVTSAYKGDSYFEVAIRNSAGVGKPQGHASPRLHWRRGHIRRLGNRTTWVRACLIGAAENGVVVHDYVA